MKTTVSAIALLLAIASPAMAASVQITDLGAPQCVQWNPYPDSSNGWFSYRAFGNWGTFLDPWARWPAFAGHSMFSGLMGSPPIPQFQEGAASVIYRFPTPQTAVTFIIANPTIANQFIFLDKNRKTVARTNGAAIVSALGPAPENDYHIQLTVQGATFQTLRMELPSSTYRELLTFADFNATCGQ